MMTHEQSIAETRLWFFDNAAECIADAIEGRQRVNDLESYVTWREEAMVDTLDGKGDHSFAFQQRRHFIQTGECVPLFSR
jgi:hypothetical protein